MAESAAASSSTEDFAALLEEQLGGEDRLEGTVLKGNVVAFEGDEVLIDVGLKSEGRVPLREFAKAGEDTDLKEGAEVEVFLERFENRNGEVVLSREKARREEAWTQLETAFNNAERVTGQIFGRVKGGFTVDLNGAVAFLPGSQVDIRPVRDVTPLMGTPQPFQILKMDRSRGNIVVSRRAVLEETRAEQRSELISSLKEGQVLQGVVKNITDYGAFVDLGGVDGLLHVTDMSWKRVNHPTDVLSIGQSVEVQVIRFNPETQRISLGMKQLEADPWEGAAAKYPTGARFKGRVTNITDYGAFVELEPGIEGLVHVSEMSWTKKNIHPGKIVSTSQEVEVMILDVDEQKRRISLGLKQCLPNPWEEFKEKYPAGTELEGEVKNITEFGLFVGLPGDIDGMVHLSDLDWERSGDEAVKDYQKGDEVKVKVLDVDTEKERISLGIKQLESDPFQQAAGEVRKGQVVTCTVTEVNDGGVEVRIGGEDGPLGFIRKAELSRDRSEQRPDRFAAGEKVDAKVTSVDKKNRKISLSIKQREADEEKAAMAEYGSADTGASLGEILGPVMRSAVKEPAEEDAGKSGGGKSTSSKTSTAKDCDLEDCDLEDCDLEDLGRQGRQLEGRERRGRRRRDGDGRGRGERGGRLGRVEVDRFEVDCLEVDRVEGGHIEVGHVEIRHVEIRHGRLRHGQVDRHQVDRLEIDRLEVERHQGRRHDGEQVDGEQVHRLEEHGLEELHRQQGLRRVERVEQQEQDDGEERGLRGVLSSPAPATATTPGLSAGRAFSRAAWGRPPRRSGKPRHMRELS